MSITVATGPRAGMREILLVDERPCDPRLIEEALRASGARLVVTVVRTGGEALEAMAAHASVATLAQPLLVLLDLEMPVWNGEAALGHVRRAHDAGSMPVVLYSRACRERDVERAYAAGANGYICKPVSLAEFVEFFQSLDRFWIDYVTPPRAARVQRAA